MNAPDRTEPSRATTRLAELLKTWGDHPPLDEAVALLSADEDPSIDAESIIRSLDELAAPLHLPDAVTVIEAVARVNTHLFASLGFEGDSQSYDDPLNSLMHRVIERRRGLPILLSVLYIEIARRVGLAVDGVGYPGHFIVRPRDADPVFYVDPFNGGEIRRSDALEARLDHLIPEALHDPTVRARFMDAVDSRYILSRMTNNLRASFMRRGDGEGVLRSVERLILLQPGVPSHRRDRGLVLLGLGRVRVGSREIERYLDENPEAPEAGVLREQVVQAADGEETSES